MLSCATTANDRKPNQIGGDYESLANISPTICRIKFYDNKNILIHEKIIVGLCFNKPEEPSILTVMKRLSAERATYMQERSPSLNGSKFIIEGEVTMRARHEN